MICKACGTEFTPRRRDQRFHRPRCRARWHRQEKEQERRRLNEHLSITAAAAELGISRHVVYRAIRAGRLRAVQVPTAGRPRFEVIRGELERYRAGRPARRPPPGDIDQEIRQAVGEMVRRVREIGGRL